MALAPRPSACRPRMKVAMSEPLMDARDRRAMGRAVRTAIRFFSRATVEGFLVGGLDKAPILIINKAPCPATRELGTLAPDPFDGVPQGLHAPGGACDRKDVGEEGEVEADGVGAQAFGLSRPDEGRDVRALNGRQGAAGERMAGQDRYAVLLAHLRRGFLGRRDLMEVAIQGLRQGRALSLGARHEHAPVHLRLDLLGPGLGLGPGGEGLSLYRVATPTDTRPPLQVTAFLDSRHFAQNIWP